LACTYTYLGDFETACKTAIRGLHIWRSWRRKVSCARSRPARRRVVACLCDKAQSEWHFGEIASCQATMAEAIAVAKKLNDIPGIAVALYLAACLSHYGRNPGEVERLASDLIELSTRQNFALWLARGTVLRGWARSASGDTVQGISWIEDGIEVWRQTVRCWVCHFVWG